MRRTLDRSERKEELARPATAVARWTQRSRAFDPDLERRIALKVLRGTATPEAKERLLREARAMARLTSRCS